MLVVEGIGRLVGSVPALSSVLDQPHCVLGGEGQASRDYVGGPEAEVSA